MRKRRVSYARPSEELSALMEPRVMMRCEGNLAEKEIFLSIWNGHLARE